MLGAGQWSSDVDVPVAPPGVTEQLVAGVAPHIGLAVTEERLEFLQELGLEDDLQDAAGQQIAAAMDEGVRAQSPAGDQAVKVWVEGEFLGPGVEYGKHAGT